MLEAVHSLPDDIAALKAMVLTSRAELAVRDAELRNRDLLIEKLKHQLTGLRRQRFGAASEALDQLELGLEDEEIARAAEAPPEPTPASKKQPKRRPLPDHLPREEMHLAPGERCADCGSRLKRLGEDVTEELEYIPGRFVVKRIVRPRLACGGCEKFHQAPLPPRPIERGRPGPGLLAHVLVSKYCDHLPLYRQSRIFARDGVELDRSTLAGWVGKATALLEPLADAVGRHVLSGQALFADDTPVKLLAPGTGRTATGRVWTYVRDERPSNGEAPPAAWYRFSADRKAVHPKSHLEGFTGWMHTDGYAGFGALARAGPVREVACLAHVRRKFFDVHAAQGSAIAAEALERIAALYAIEKEARGQPPERRAAIRRAKAAPCLDAFERWLQSQLPKISAKTPLAAAVRHALTRMKRLRPYIDNGFLEIDNNPAERAMRPIALGRKNYLFMGSASGGRAAAIAYTLIETARLNDVDPQAWLAQILERIPDYKINRVDELLPWNCPSAEDRQADA
ncbi:MAG: IS66 family transposase [Rhodospirillaceae bacterium]|nr:IS66 family transposase [Rhodospirillaceae bacterium]